MSDLVSVPVITYNSAAFVEETLESIYNQMHQNIQLIVSDDCSRDNTVAIVEKWCEQPRVKERFSDIKIITVPENTGIPSNCNRGIAVSDGEWIKLIAGDDILCKNCLSDNLQYIKECPNDVEVILSQISQFTHDKNLTIKNSVSPDPNVHAFYREEITSTEQYSMWLNIHKYWPLCTPSLFIRRHLLLSVGGYDEQYRYMEDLPLFLKILERKIKIYFLPKVTVLYRIHNESILRIDAEKYIISKFQVSKNSFIKDYILSRVPWNQRIRLQYELLFDKLVLIAGNKGKIAKIIHKAGTQLNPVRLNWFRRKFNRNNHQK